MHAPLPLPTPALLIPRDNDRANHFDAIRLTMAVAVIWSHSFALYYGSERDEPVSLLLSGVYNTGNLAVMVFFIVSGFLISQSFVKSTSSWSFIKKRVCRIYPGYLVATAICAFIIVPLFSTIRDMSLQQVVNSIGGNLLLKNVFPPSNAFTRNIYPNAVNGSLWSIPFEAWCYVGVLALGTIGLLSRRWFILAATISLLALRVALDVLEKKPGGGVIGLIIGWPYLWTVIGPSFLLGMVAFNFRNVIPRNGLFLIGAIGATIAASYFSKHIAHMIVAPTLAYATFYVAYSKASPLPAARLGDASYGTYLYAFPIQQMLIATFMTSIAFIEFVFLSISLSLIAGLCSWHVVEKRFLRPRVTPRHQPSLFDS